MSTGKDDNIINFNIIRTAGSPGSRSSSESINERLNDFELSKDDDDDLSIELSDDDAPLVPEYKSRPDNLAPTPAPNATPVPTAAPVPMPTPKRKCVPPHPDNMVCTQCIHTTPVPNAAPTPAPVVLVPVPMPAAAPMPAPNAAATNTATHQENKYPEEKADPRPQDFSALANQQDAKVVESFNTTRYNDMLDQALACIRAAVYTEPILTNTDKMNAATNMLPENDPHGNYCSESHIEAIEERVQKKLEKDRKYNRIIEKVIAKKKKNNLDTLKMHLNAKTKRFGGILKDKKQELVEREKLNDRLTEGRRRVAKREEKASRSSRSTTSSQLNEILRQLM